MHYLAELAGIRLCLFQSVDIFGRLQIVILDRLQTTLEFGSFTKLFLIWIAYKMNFWIAYKIPISVVAYRLDFESLTKKQYMDRLQKIIFYSLQRNHYR